MTDPPRFSDGESGETGRLLFRSLRDDAPPPDLKARMLASLQGPPPPEPPDSPPPPPSPSPAPPPAGLVPTALVPKSLLGFALIGLIGAAIHWAGVASPPRVTETALASSSPPAAPSPPPSSLPGTAQKGSRFAFPDRAPSAPHPLTPPGPDAPSASPGSPPPEGPLPGSPPPESPLPEGSLPEGPRPAEVHSAALSPPGAATPPTSPGDSPRRSGGARESSPGGRGSGASGRASRAAATTAPPAEPATAPVAAVSPSPAPAVSAPSPARLRLEGEVALLERAEQAIKSGDGPRALGLLAQYRENFGDGQLGLEAAAMEIESLLLAGDRSTSVRLARRFLAAHPRSHLAPRVRALCPTCAEEKAKTIP